MFPLHARRAGYALPVTVLVIGFITAGVVAAFSRTSAEVRIVDNQNAQTSAFAIAQAGLERYVARGKTSPADTTMTLTGGSARVRATLMRPAANPSDTAIYLIRSEATTLGRGAVPQGRRTVAQFAYRLRGQMQVKSAWTTISGLVKNGASGIITGKNACGTDTVAGVALPDGTYTQEGSGDPLQGKPPLLEMGTQEQMADSIKIDWSGITNPVSPSLTADFVICFPGTYGYDPAWGPCSSWPMSGSWINSDFWPTVVLNGTSSLPGNGRGTLIVTGDLTLNGGDRWDGILLVGGRIVDHGSGEIAGAVVSGLNVLKGWTVEKSSKADGTKDYQYDSCKVQRAADNHMRLVQIPSSWVDNWHTW
jgi:Tfp pilus assembly protein PilX